MLMRGSNYNFRDWFQEGRTYMPPRRTRGLALAALAALATMGWGRSAAAQVDYVAKARADSALKPYTAADVHFMAGMIPHHAQAIAMARLAATHDASPSIRTLAERIINAQTDEITLLQQWLRDRLQHVPEAKPGPMKMRMSNGMEHDMLMPGMITDAQMQQLDRARGKAFDTLFLTLMIQHHRGAVGMVKELFGSPGAGQDDTVFKMANDINVDQTTEIARMERMLAAVALGITIP
jgi:uncharacterized protein (DUF305 family)